jgi:Family of unknown function (DUF5906)
MENSQAATLRELFDADAAWRKYAKSPYLSETIGVIPPNASLSPNSTVKRKMCGKVPGKLTSSGWVGLALKWKDDLNTSEEDAGKWGRSGAVVGMQGRLFPGIDIDVEEASQARTIKELAFDHLGLTVVRSRSGSPRVLLIYRSTRLRKHWIKWTDVNGATHAVELLGYGQYYNIEGPHPKGGAYEWEYGEGLCDVGINNIPEIDAAAVDSFFVALEELIKAAGGTITSKNTSNKGGSRIASNKTGGIKSSIGAPRKVIGDPSHLGEVDLLNSAMEFCPNTAENVPTHDDAVMWTAAWKAGYGDTPESRTRIVAWLAQYSGNDAAYCKKLYDSIRDSALGAEWIYAQATARGWTDGVQRAFAQAQIDFATDKDPNAAIPKTAIDKAVGDYVYVKKQAEYHDTTNGSVLTSDKEFNAANTEVEDYGRSGLHSAAAAFLNHPGARKVDVVTSRPGAELITKETNEFGASVTAINLWRPSPVEANKHATSADVAPWLGLLEELFGPEGSPERKHFLDYWAFVLQHPGEKIGHAIVVVGAQGTGKDTLLRPLFEAVGVHNVAPIDTNTLFGQWSYYLRYQIVYVQEIMTNGRRDLYNHIKPYVSGQATRLAVNEKNRRQFFVPNNQNWIITSNHDNAITLEDDDRRFWVHRVLNDDAPPPDEYFAELHRWCASGGTENVYGWLLKRDVSGFNPMARPPMTAAKRTMLEASQPAPVRWLRELLGKAFAGRAVVTVGEILKRATQQDWAHQDINAKNVMAALKVEGFTRAHRVRVGRDMLPLWTRGAAAALDQDKMREQYLAESAATGAGEGTKEKEAA